MGRIERIAAMLGEKVVYKKYRMWHHVPFICSTAIVFDEIVEGGGYGIIPPREFPRSITDTYIVKAIKSNAISLGEYTLHEFTYSFKDFMNAGIPEGYETHRTGDGYVEEESLVDKLMAM